MAEDRHATIANAEMIRNTPLGEELSESQCDALADKVNVIHLDKGDFLIEEGKTDDSLFVIISGQIEVLVRSNDGKTVTLHILKEGNLAGELGFLDNHPHSAGLRALDSATVISLSRKDFESFIQADPDLMYKVMRSIMRTVHAILFDMNQSHVEMNNYIYKQHGRY